MKVAWRPEFDKGRDFVKNEIKTFKRNCVDQIFTGENNKKHVEFLTFLSLHCTCFFIEIFPGLWVNFLVLLSHIPYQKSEELPLACLFEVFTG